MNNKNYKPMPEFKITLADPTLLKDSIRVMKGIVNEARFRFKKDMLEIVEMDSCNVSMVIFKLLSSACVEWDIKKEFTIGLNLNSLYSVLKNSKDSDMITLERKEDYKLAIWLKNVSNREYSIPIIEIEEKEQKAPELSFKAKVSMPSELFAEQIKEADTVAESVYLKAEKDTFILNAKGDLSELNIVNKADDNIRIDTDSKIVSKYSIGYLKKYLDCKKLSDDVSLEFSNDYPLKLSYKVIDKISFEFIQAPRVNE